MRKLLSGFICLAIMLLSMPGLARAETSPKQVFINDYLAYFDHSAEMQAALLQSLQQNTIRFVLDAELSDVNISCQDGAKLSNMPGRASLALAFNLADPRASLNFQIKASEYTMKGSAFFTKDGLIVPRETIWSLAGSGVDFKYLGDLDRLPPYIVYDTELSPRDFSQLNQAIKESADNQARQLEAMKTLMQVLLNMFPEKCFYYDDSKPVMDLTKVSLAELLEGFKEHSDSLADQFNAMMNKPAGMSDTEFEEMKKQVKTGLVEGINNLSAEDINQALKDFPVELQTCKIKLSSGNIESLLEARGSLPEGIVFSLSAASTGHIKGTAVDSTDKIDLYLKTAEFNMDIQIISQGSTDLNNGTFSCVISGKGGEQKNTIQGKINLKGAIDWSDKGGIWAPQTDYLNSKKVKFPKNSYDSVQVFLNGEALLFKDAEPLLRNGTVVVPVRSLADALGCELDWEAPDTVLLKHGEGEYLSITVGSPLYKIGDSQYSMSETPFIHNGRVYVPLRTVSEYCGLSVEWDAGSRIVRLYR